MKRIIIFLLALILIVPAYAVPAYAGTSVFDRGPAEEKASSRTSAPNIEEAFVKGDYNEVVRMASSYLNYRPKNDEKIQCLMGRALLKLNRLDEGRSRFFKVAEETKDKKFQAEATIGIADSYYLDEEYRQARDYYEKVARLYPDLDNMNIVYYALGKCYSKLDNAATAKEYYDKLMRLYPNSLEAKLLKGEGTDSVTYCVQVGSFNKLENAERLRAELKSKGFDAFIQTVTVEGTYFYRVRVGKYSRIGDVEDVARNLRNKGYTTKVCP
ncbi:MAG: SPOR domain-containing protein [Candidatus Omnitrophica bacterium]|nr:SPOR domain-containing protein [Candidatus Omnitrophota bacterium]MBU4487447.1 SPOR domain-containing protein [Candidatus Omnitrophota bacterium]MCG2705093.1 SPOR domain-containing protein [Candidatus Omnitrophota bacterium]